MPETHQHHNTTAWIAFLAAVCLLGAACSGGEVGPRQGTPEWYFQAAKDNYAMGDYTKTVEQLKDAMKAEGETGAMAAVWRFALTGGLAVGYDDLADAFVTGMEANDAMTDAFQPSINDYRRRTRINAIEFAEGVGPIKKMVDAGGMVSLDVPLPEGNGSMSPILGSIENGNKVVESQISAMEDQTLTRGHLQRALDAGGRQGILETHPGGLGGIRSGVRRGGGIRRGPDPARYVHHVRPGRPQRSKDPDAF